MSIGKNRLIVNCFDGPSAFLLQMRCRASLARILFAVLDPVSYGRVSGLRS